MSQITLFTDILPEEQERMRVCFQQMDLENSVRWMWKNRGMMKQEDTSLES